MDGPITVEPPGPVDLSDDIDLTDELELDQELVDDLEPVPVVDVDQVRRLLAGAGSAAAFALADPDVPDHWRFTDSELDDIAPAITAIANRRPQLARAIESSDYLVLGVHMARYAGRNVQAGRAARNAREERDDAINGQARPAGGFGLATAQPPTSN
jgi:hypothetical protein